MKTLRLWLAQNYGMLLAIGVFASMFALYVSNHSAGLTVPVVITAANKAVLLALVAMAQTIPILTGGLDLSVGMIFIMTNSLASNNHIPVHSAYTRYREDVIRAGLTPGPTFKVILEAAYDAQLEGSVRTREEALTLVQRLVAQSREAGS